MEPCVLLKEATTLTWIRSGSHVDLSVDAHQQIFVIRRKSEVLKQVPIKGLQHTLLSFEEFAALMCTLALSEQRRLLQAQQRVSATVS